VTKRREFYSYDEDATVVGRPAPVPPVKTGKRAPRLEQVQGPGAPRSFELELDETIVGRAVQAHVCVPSSLISRRHMALRKAGPQFSCADLDSANGVLLNGVKAHSAVLHEGDTLQIGDVVFVFHEGD
jgi:pSer/pThr/pTyr-binding forkhead associated (FHA) protein